jgi:uncharacterized protein (DUF2141 family)
LVAVAVVGSCILPSSLEAQGEEDPAAANTLSIEIIGIDDAEGKLACALFWDNKGFPRKHRRALRRTWVEVEGPTAQCVFKRTGLGQYAASVFLDKNRNGKLDTNAIGSQLGRVEEREGQEVRPRSTMMRKSTTRVVP